MPQRMSGKATIYIDGASRNNPGPASIGVVIQQGENTVSEFGKYIGETTNNVAEYTACIEALKKAHRLGIVMIEMYSDSQLLVRQILGEYRVKEPHLQKLMSTLQEEKNKFVKFTIKHIPREKNVRADELANQALDALK